jgi:predicted nucleotidyltransferase
MKTVLKRAERIASRLGRIEGVVAVALGGSWARGDALPDSDMDLGIYYHPHSRPDITAVRQLAQELDDRHTAETITDFGGWGPWINGGGWLEIEGERVDWIYRDLALVNQVIDDCRAGCATCYYQPGHPHGFHNYIYMGELYFCQILYDPEGTLAALKALTMNYPPHLKRALIDKYLWEAIFSLDTSSKPATRSDTFYVSGTLFRCAAALTQVLFALNEQYCINEKGALKAVETLPRHPDGFSKTVIDVLAQPGHNTAQLRASIQQFRELIQAVQELC